MKNPPWTRDELILALALYLPNRWSPPDDKSPEVIALSRLLNDLGRKLGRSGGKDFRNPNGVSMKLMNFRRLDPEFTSAGRKGLTRGNKDEPLVWQEFADQPERLARVAEAIRRSVLEDAPLPGQDIEEDEGLVEAPEGRLLTRVHRVRERNRTLVQRRKAQALKQRGRLVCQACGFDFEAAYGERGRGIIECHHTKPVHELAPGQTTRLEDLALLCANCHRMVHAGKPWLTLEELKYLFTKS